MLHDDTLCCATCHRRPSIGHGTMHFVIDSTTEEEQRLNEAQNKLSVLADKRDEYVQRQRTPIPGFRPKS